MRELFTLNTYFWKYKWLLFSGFILVIVSNYFAMLQPDIVGEAVNDAKSLFENPNPDKDIKKIFIIHGGKIILYAFLSGLASYFTRKTIIVASRKIEFDLRNDILNHYQKMSADFFKKRKTGDLMSRITEDVNKVRMYLGPAVLYGVNLLVLFALAIPMMMNTSVKLTLWSLLPLPFLSVSIYFVSNVINKRSKVLQEHLSGLTSIAQESYSGIRVLKSYVQEHSMIQFFKDKSYEYKLRSMDLYRVNSLFFPLMLLLTGASTIITVWAGGYYLIRGESGVTYGAIAAFIIYINKLTWPVTSVGWVASIIQSASASQKRINEFLFEKPAIHDVENGLQDISFNKITFNNVTLTYEGMDLHALENISFSIKQGEKLLIVGRTGSGKTSLLELLLRVRDVTSGDISIDEVPIENYSLATLRNSISYVSQDVVLLSDTVSNNIKFSDDSLTEEEIIQMSKNVSVYEDILTLKDGLNTTIGEKGVTLSGGQKQRVAMARALIKPSKLVVLDDCLSAIDAKTEESIVSYLKNSKIDNTLILATHRIPSNWDFDKILVLEMGKIQAFGTHKDLYLSNNFYTEMYNANIKI